MENKNSHLSALELGSLCVYRKLLADPVIGALRELLSAETAAAQTEGYANFFSAMSQAGCTNTLADYVAKQIIYCDCPFSRQAAKGEVSKELILAAARDLGILYRAAFITPVNLEYIDGSLIDGMPLWFNGDGFELLDIMPWESKVIMLCEYYKENFFGMYAKYKAFAWRENKLVPLANTDPIRLSSLKGYENQQKPVVENTISFLEGIPANNVLLYGDRGTGKSSTIHAILNEFAPRGLRMVDMPKSAICRLPALIAELAELPLKFIVFIDDLSFAAEDDSFAELKAALEGGLAAHSNNMLIYATSNRRHLVREKFSDRDGDELHAADTRQEQMSLSDRFGLSITFINPDRARFYTILDSLAAERGLTPDPDRLHRSGEKWALENGGRSPRTARQFINHLQAAVSRNLDW